MTFRDPKAYIVIKSDDNRTVQIAQLIHTSITTSTFEPAEIRGVLGGVKNVDVWRLLDRYRINEAITDEELITLLEADECLE